MQIQGGLPNWQLFAIAVVIWSTTWHAILYQLDPAAASGRIGNLARVTLFQ